MRENVSKIWGTGQPSKNLMVHKSYECDCGGGDFGDGDNVFESIKLVRIIDLENISLTVEGLKSKAESLMPKIGFKDIVINKSLDNNTEIVKVSGYINIAKKYKRLVFQRRVTELVSNSKHHNLSEIIDIAHRLEKTYHAKDIYVAFSSPLSSRQNLSFCISRIVDAGSDAVRLSDLENLARAKFNGTSFNEILIEGGCGCMCDGNLNLIEGSPSDEDIEALKHKFFTGIIPAVRKRLGLLKEQSK